MVFIRMITARKKKRDLFEHCRIDNNKKRRKTKKKQKRCVSYQTVQWCNGKGKKKIKYIIYKYFGKFLCLSQQNKI